jgi:hypothetical protein
MERLIFSVETFYFCPPQKPQLSVMTTLKPLGKYGNSRNPTQIATQLHQSDRYAKCLLARITPESIGGAAQFVRKSAERNSGQIAPKFIQIH